MSIDNILQELVIKLRMDGVQLTQTTKAVTGDLSKLEKGAKNSQEKVSSLANDTRKFGKDGAEAFAAVRREAFSYFALFTGGRGIKSFIQDMTQAGVSLDNISKQLGVAPQKIAKFRAALTSVGSDSHGYEQLLLSLQRMTTSSEGMGVLTNKGRQMGVQFLDAHNQIRNDILDQLNGSQIFQNSSRAKQLELLRLIGGNADLLNLVDHKNYKGIVNDPAFQGLGQTKEQIEQQRKLLYDWVRFQAETSKILQRSYSDIEPVVDTILNALTGLEKAHPRIVATGLDALATAIIALGTVTIASPLIKAGSKIGKLLGIGSLAAGGEAAVLTTEASSGPFGLLLAGITATAIGGYEAYQHPQEVKGALNWTKTMGKAQWSLLTDPRAREIGKILSSSGMRPVEVAGLLSNIQKESGFDPQAAPKNGEHAYGLLQWHPARQKDFKSVFGHDIRESTLEEQAKFILWERKHNEKKAFRAIEHARSAAEAGALTSLNYVRPYDKVGEAQKRALLADQIQASLDATSGRTNSQTNHINVNVGDIKVTSHHADPVQVASAVGQALPDHFKNTFNDLRKTLAVRNNGGAY